jgi:hypothetical protein
LGGWEDEDNEMGEWVVAKRIESKGISETRSRLRKSVIQHHFSIAGETVQSRHLVIGDGRTSLTRDLLRCGGNVHDNNHKHHKEVLGNNIF